MDRGLAARLHLQTKEVLACHLIRSERLIFGSARKITNFDVRPLSGLDMVMDIQDMSALPDSSFDGMIAIAVLQHVADDRKALREIKRILRPGGFALIHVYAAEKHTSAWPDVTHHYGTENYERYRVGTYRMYGYEDFEALLSNFLKVELVPSFDPLTGQRSPIFVGWKEL